MRLSPMISSDCSTLSASVPTIRSLIGSLPSGVKTKSSPTREMKDVGQRGLIRDRRNGAVVEAAIEEQPRVGALLVGRGKADWANANRFSVRNDASGATIRGLRRLVEREAAGLVAGAQPESRDVRALDLGMPGQAQLLAAVRRVRVDTSAAPPTRPSARSRPFPNPSASEAPRGSRRNAPTDDDDETGKGDERRGQHAARRPPARVGGAKGRCSSALPNGPRPSQPPRERRRPSRSSKRPPAPKNAAT